MYVVICRSRDNIRVDGVTLNAGVTLNIGSPESTGFSLRSYLSKAMPVLS